MAKMTIAPGKEELWEKTVEVNSHDGYSAEIIEYAERWACMMEEEIDESDADPADVIMEVADQTSRDADVNGITGAMFQCALSVLRQTWAYGEEISEWDPFAPRP